MITSRTEEVLIKRVEDMLQQFPGYSPDIQISLKVLHWQREIEGQPGLQGQDNKHQCHSQQRRQDQLNQYNKQPKQQGELQGQVLRRSKTRKTRLFVWRVIKSQKEFYFILTTLLPYSHVLSQNISVLKASEEGAGIWV